MKIQLLIASEDSDYVEHLSRVLMDRHGEVFEMSVCSSTERMKKLLSGTRFDVALLGSKLVAQADLAQIRLPLLLWEDTCAELDLDENVKKVRKYQRISTLMSEVLEGYAEVSQTKRDMNQERAHITVVWSPAGGCGKTTVALAFATQKVAEGEGAVYLNLEAFSSQGSYFVESGKSISTAFQRLDKNVELVLQSIRQKDLGSGVCYYGRPENYDDIRVLSEDEIRTLVWGSACGVERLVVDLSSTWDEKTRVLMELADTVLVVLDGTSASKMKWEQFCTQHNTFCLMQEKMILVANRGCNGVGGQTVRQVSLPMVQSDNPVVVYKTLSGGYLKI